MTADSNHFAGFKRNLRLSLICPMGSQFKAGYLVQLHSCGPELTVYVIKTGGSELSSIIFHIAEDQVLVATDTLATSYDGKPEFFTSKVHILPHLKMMIAGTGVAGFLDRWFVVMNGRKVRGIDFLDEHAPGYLAAIWSAYKEEICISDDLTTTTVYHFGFSERTGLIHGYVYKSDSTFASDSLPYGTGSKPECSIPEHCKFPGDIRKMMDEQREIQARQPMNQRLHIGGEILIHHLTAAGFNVFPLARFDDFKNDEATIFQKR